MAHNARAPESSRVAAVIADPVARAGLVLERVQVTPAGKRRVVRVVVDLPDDETGSLDLDRIADVSRVIDQAMDAAEPFGQSPYVLEVSSPGVSRPLTERRHWARARGRLVSVAVAGSALTGRVSVVDDEGVVLVVDESDRQVRWADLGTGRVQVEFSHHDELNPDELDPDELDPVEPGDASLDEAGLDDDDSGAQAPDEED